MYNDERSYQSHFYCFGFPFIVDTYLSEMIKVDHGKFNSRNKIDTFSMEVAKIVKQKLKLNSYLECF